MQKAVKQLGESYVTKAPRERSLASGGGWAFIPNKEDSNLEQDSCAGRGSFNKKKELHHSVPFQILLLLFALMLSGYAGAQTITFKGTNIPLKTVFAAIKEQTGYGVFVFGKENLLKEAQPVTITATGMPLKTFLDLVFKSQPFAYQLSEKNILLVPRSQSSKADRNIDIKPELQQEIQVKGKVVNSEGTPLRGVNISTPRTGIGTVTGSDGSFSIRIKDNDALRITFVGLAPITIRIRGNVFIQDAGTELPGSSKILKADPSSLVVQLSASNAPMEDVVVIGYGQVNRKDLTGSVGSANVTDMAKAPVGNFEEALAGRVAGVQVTSNDGQPGNDLNIVVRGNNSITQDNAPLYVVDGFPVESSIGNTINPEEIASVEVLKDASATAIYGARGANGVIIITTKKGTSNKAEVNYNAWLGINKEINRVEVMDPYEFVKYQLEENYNKYAPVYLSGGKTLDSYADMKGIDWQDLAFHSAYTQSHTLSVRGRNDRTQYSFSGSIFRQDGIVINSGFNRAQGRIVLDQKISDKVKVGANINYAATKKYGIVIGEATTSPTTTLMYNLWGFRPVLGDIDADNGLVEVPYDPDVDPVSEYRVNPITELENAYRPVYGKTFNSNAYVQAQLAKNLILKISGGMNNTDTRREIFNNSKTRAGNPYTASGVNGSLFNQEQSSYLNENTLTYEKRFNKEHLINILAGVTYQKTNSKYYGFTATQVPNEALGISGLDEGTVSSSISSENSNVLLSGLGRINYTYQSKYLLTASWRADGSSKFPKQNRWSYFPSAAFAWKLKQEHFMEPVSWITDLKLRAGYGITGNNRVGDFDYLSSLQIYKYTGYSFGNSVYTGIVPDNLGNNELKWERTGQLDLGVDISLFKSRLSATVDYYKKKTSDLLIYASLAPSTGFLNGYKNVGEVSNEGVEITLNATVIKKKRFEWNSSFNIAFNRNRVVKLNDNQSSLATNIIWGNFNNAYPYIAIPGEPIAQFYGYLFDGVYQYTDFNKLADGTYVLKDGLPDNGLPRTRVQPGYIKYKDINGDGTINSKDLTIIGDPNPLHFGGFSNNLRYENFDFNIFLQWSYGNDILNANRIEFEGGESGTRNFLNQYKSFENRWTPENQTNMLYKVGGQGPIAYSSRIIEDGSYIRLKTVSLGYNLEKGVVKRIGLNNVRIYIAAQNILTLTNYSGMDPEVSVRNSALTPGFDFSAYPRSKTATFGIQVTF